MEEGVVSLKIVGAKEYPTAKVIHGDRLDFIG
jgi:hypothetical protein